MTSHKPRVNAPYNKIGHLHMYVSPGSYTPHRAEMSRVKGFVARSCESDPAAK